jgi:copper chaperone CopZ
MCHDVRGKETMALPPAVRLLPLLSLLLLHPAFAQAADTVASNPQTPPSLATSSVATPDALAPAGEVLVVVKGVASPFATFGIVKGLSKMPGVAHVHFNMQRGLADIVLKPGARLSDEEIRRVVRTASYTPGEIRWKTPVPATALP